MRGAYFANLYQCTKFVSCTAAELFEVETIVTCKLTHNSWSSQLLPFERFFTVSCQCSIVTMTLCRIISKIGPLSLFVLRKYTNVTDGQTDRRMHIAQTPHGGIGHAYA